MQSFQVSIKEKDKVQWGGITVQASLCPLPPISSQIVHFSAVIKILPCMCYVTAREAHQRINTLGFLLWVSLVGMFCLAQLPYSQKADVQQDPSLFLQCRHSQGKFPVRVHLCLVMKFLDANQGPTLELCLPTQACYFLTV